MLNFYEIQQKLQYFTVEKSKDSIHFSAIENVIATNHNVTATYTTVDNSPFAGTNFYRLKLKNTDSSFTYSQLVNVNLPILKLGLKITPNPVKNILTLNTNGENEKAKIVIFNAFGNKFKELKVALNGNTTISVDIEILAPGFYTLQLIKKSSIETSTFLKQ